MIYQLLRELHVARHGLRQRHKACNGHETSDIELQTSTHLWIENNFLADRKKIATYVCAIRAPVKNVAEKGGQVRLSEFHTMRKHTFQQQARRHLPNPGSCSTMRDAIGCVWSCVQAHLLEETGVDVGQERGSAAGCVISRRDEHDSLVRQEPEKTKWLVRQGRADAAEPHLGYRNFL
jgi:hypothetical protein